MREFNAYRISKRLTQQQLAKVLGVSQAYVSQLESGRRRVSRKLAAKLAAIPEPERLEPTIFPEALDDLDARDVNLATDLAALGYPPFAGHDSGRRRNPAALVIAIVSGDHVAPGVMASVPWLLLSFSAINVRWLIDQARLRNLQNRLGFLNDLARQLLARRRASGAHVDEALAEKLERLSEELEASRLVREDTLARRLTSAERDFFEQHRTGLARHWNLHTGLTIDQLPYR